MGVPSLFRTLVNKHPNICKQPSGVEPPDQLLFDFNCLVHHCANAVKLTDSMTLRDIEEEVIAEVIKYTGHIITSVVKPKSLVFIALDGPVPMGKVVRQRARRYKKIQDDRYKRKLREKYNIPATRYFDSNKITPGTPFMSKLCNRLRNMIKLGAFGNNKVILSDANAPGEGEHKIMNFLKNGKAKTATIYGLDADLIILSMNLPINVVLLREDLEWGGEFLFLDVRMVTDALIKEYKLEFIDRASFIRDYTFITCFGGNDFVDPFVHTKIRDQGVDKLMNAYRIAMCHTNSTCMIDESLEVDRNTFIVFLEELCKTEDVSMKKINNRLQTCKFETKGEKSEYDREYELYEHSYYTDTKNPFHSHHKRSMQTIQYNKDHTVWSKQYNDTYFDAEMSTVCSDYMKVILWTMKYYMDNSPISWLWYYPHRNAPLVSELRSHIENNPKFWDHTFEEDECLTPFEQLLIVLPHQNAGLLPFSLQWVVKELADTSLYPTKFLLDSTKGLKNIYSEPLLPPVDLDSVRYLLHNVPYSEPEIARNVLKTKK